VVYSALDLELHAELTNPGKAGWSRHVADEVHPHTIEMILVDRPCAMGF